MEEPIKTSEEPSSAPILPQNSIRFLLQAAPWMKFMSILGIISMGLMLIGLLFLGQVRWFPAA